MGINLTEKQRVRLEFLACEAGRSMSNMIGRLIDLEFETKTACQERETESVGAQNPEPEKV